MFGKVKEVVDGAIEDYREALKDARPKVKEIILEHAAQHGNLYLPDFVRLCKLADPESALALGVIGGLPPADNIRHGVAYLGQLLTRYGSAEGSLSTRYL